MNLSVYLCIPGDTCIPGTITGVERVTVLSLVNKKSA